MPRNGSCAEFTTSYSEEIKRTTEVPAFQRPSTPPAFQTTWGPRHENDVPRFTAFSVSPTVSSSAEAYTAPSSEPPVKNWKKPGPRL